MKHIKKQFLTLLFFAAGIMAFAQVGIETTSPEGALDVVSTNSGLIASRVATTAAVTSPVNGMLIYDRSTECIKAYKNGAWSDCLSSIPNDPTALTFNSVKAYKGVSVIGSEGIGYNGEAVPAASTIEVNVTAASATSYSFVTTEDNTDTGLEYSATGTFDAAGTYPVTLQNNGADIGDFFSGEINLTLTGASNTLALTPRIDIKSIPVNSTTVTDVTEVKDVIYGTQIWMDRNLGARRVANARDDVFSYGNYYQWGRPADEHEIFVWNGETTTVGRGLEGTTDQLATTDNPGDANFILTSGAPNDWRKDNNNNRWATTNQGPCPEGYHVPTEAEWVTADAYDNGATVGWDNAEEAFASDLKLPSAGNRDRFDGLLSFQGTLGYYWSSSVSGAIARRLFFSNTSASTSNYSRAYGFPVRCLKSPDPTALTFNSVKAYKGVSVIGPEGIGYNGEEVPAASTIEVNVTAASATSYRFVTTEDNTNTGLEYSATGAFPAAGTYPVILYNNGADIGDFFSGEINLTLTGANNTLALTPRIDVKSLDTSDDPDWEYEEVIYGDQIWMDRNLGARRVALDKADVFSYGNHYQWGRPADGHEISVWNGKSKTAGRGLEGTTDELATTDNPTNPKFIISSGDWRKDNNNNRWATTNQGPCPTGYHVPTEAEWDTADAYNNGATLGWDNAEEAFASDLKLPSAGRRHRINGLLTNQGTIGFCWNSTVSGTNALSLIFGSLVAHNNFIIDRAFGFSVRCLRD